MLPISSVKERERKGVESKAGLPDNNGHNEEAELA
jgi:hypothetical protein